MVHLIKFGLLIIPLALLYAPVMLEMGREWYTDPNYSHGFLIPAISGYFLWHNRDRLKDINPYPMKIGYVVLVFGLGIYILGTMGDEMFSRRISFVFVLAGLVLLFGGKEWFCQVRFPLFYLILMIPLPYFIYNELSVPLKMFAAETATAVLQFFSYTVLREGNIIHLPNITLEVADACSGMRSLLSIIALTFAIAWVFHSAVWKRLALVLASIPIAVAVNVVRIIGTGMLSHRYGAKAAMGFFHEFAGMVIFGAALILLFGSSFLLGRLGEMEKE